MSSKTDTAAFAAMLNELRGPLTGVAATLNKGNGPSNTNGFAEDDLRKVNFSELAQRFEQLSAILPDALRCVQEVREQQGCVSRRLEVLDGRLKSEEAYLSSLHEAEEAIVSQRGTVEDDIKERIEQLRRVTNEREEYLIQKLRAVENDKLATIDRQREQCLTVLESMRSASSQARAALADEDMAIWLDTGKIIEEKLSRQNAIKVEYGPSPDLKFGCTLTLDLQVRILEVIDFDEKKAPPSPFKLGTIMGATSPNAAGSRAGASAFYSGGTLNESGATGPSSELVLPDGTDYAAFRRSLLAEVDWSGTQRSNRVGGIGSQV